MTVFSAQIDPYKCHLLQLETLTINDDRTQKKSNSKRREINATESD